VERIELIFSFELELEVDLWSSKRGIAGGVRRVVCEGWSGGALLFVLVCGGACCCRVCGACFSLLRERENVWCSGRVEEMVKFEQGSYVFVPDEDAGYLAAVVESSFEQGKAGQVKLVDSKRRIKLGPEESAKAVEMDAQSLEPLEDMVMLKKLDEPAILHNLRLRYKRDDIYTNIGTILVAVNPFKLLPIYNPEIVDAFVKNGGRNMSPHVFGVADDAYRNLTGFGKNQSCIVSGESGSGKTETTKLFLQYLGEKSSSSSSTANLREQILLANPLMEAFGNAKTIRNDNSSRFGKLIEVSFDWRKGNIAAGAIQTYLLEKSRLVQQAEGERNYHVFYQLCAAASLSPDLTETFSLKDADQYWYLNQSKEKASTVVPGMSDSNGWENTIAAMEVLGLSNAQRDDIVRVLAGILHLGNIRFAGSDEKSSVETKEALAIAADQLGMKSIDLEKAICMRNRGNTKESVYSNQGVEQAKESRDALAKAIYSNLFDWLIEQINACLSQQVQQKSGKPLKDDKKIIGVLDIFGFESFEHNSYEQLCINYCNEKLQSHFNNHIFKLEQEEYKREGLDISEISFDDNRPILEAIEGKKTGIISILDEEGRLPRGSDESFLTKVLQQAGTAIMKPDSKTQRKNKSSRAAFTVMHYAGAVMYDSRGFLEKNKDLLLGDLAALGYSSSFKFVANLSSRSAKGGRGGKDANKKTIGTQFKEQLQDLMTTLNSTEPHYVRCIKPNSNKAAQQFEAKDCLDQLRYAGLLEVCRIRKAGYPVRKSFKEFVQRYRPLAVAAAASGDHIKLAKELEKKGLLAKGQWQVGKSKVFLRTDQFNDLEAAREAAVSDVAAMLQKTARRFIARRRYKKISKVLDNIVKATKARKADAIENALLGTGKLPFQGRHLAQVKDAKALLDRLREEDRVKQMLKEAIQAADRSALESALEAAKEMNMMKDDVVSRAKKALETIEKQKGVSAELRAAIDKRDIKALTAAIKKADALSMAEASENMDAKSLKAKLEEEQKAINDTNAAIKKKDVAAIKKLLVVLAELGLENDPVTKKAQEIAKSEAKRSAAAQEQMRQLQMRLTDAMESLDLSALERYIRQAIDIGFRGGAVDEANKLRKELAGKADYVSKITAAMKALEIKASSHEGITAKDIKPLSEAIQKASDAGFKRDDEEMGEAIELEERMNKQIEIQEKVNKALESKSEAALREVVPLIQEYGLQTGKAKQVLQEARSRDASKSNREMEKVREERMKNRKKLREAAPEERLKDDLLRVVQADEEAFQAQLKEASDNSRYAFKKFFRIRTTEDFTEYVADDLKPQYAEYQLKCQAKPIPKSILDLDDDLSKIAIQNHKAILQYCGELANSFPTAMAGYISVRGQETPELADEIYIQLLKHVIENRRPVSEDRAWALLCIVTRTFPPSDEFMPFVLNFFINQRSLAASSLIINYARLCLVQIVATKKIGSSDFLPDMDTLETYSSRPAVLAEISNPDGSILRIPVTPDQDIAYVLEICNQNAGVKEDEAQLHSIFVIDGPQNSGMDLKERLIRFYKKYNPSKLVFVDYFVTNWSGNEETLFATLQKKYGPEPDHSEDVDSPGKRRKLKRGESKGFLRLPVTAARSAIKMLGLTAENTKPAPSPEVPWPLPWWAYLGDVFIRMAKQNRQPILAYKRMIIFKDEAMTDPLFEQVRSEIRDGDLAIGDLDKLALLALYDLMIENGGKKIGKIKGKSFQDAAVEALPQHALQQKPATEWEKLIKDKSAEAEKLPRTPQKLKAAYYDLARESSVFGMSTFTVQPYQQDEILYMGINADGLHMLADDRSKIVTTFKFRVIEKFGASGQYFWVLVNDGKTPMTHYFKALTPWSLYGTVFSVTQAVASLRS